MCAPGAFAVARALMRLRARRLARRARAGAVRRRVELRDALGVDADDHVDIAGQHGVQARGRVGDREDLDPVNMGGVTPIVVEPRMDRAHARLELTELENRIGVFLTEEDREEDFDTLGGLVFSLAGRIPIRGEILTHASGWRFMVMDC